MERQDVVKGQILCYPSLSGSCLEITDVLYILLYLGTCLGKSFGCYVNVWYASVRLKAWNGARVPRSYAGTPRTRSLALHSHALCQPQAGPQLRSCLVLRPPRI